MVDDEILAINLLRTLMIDISGVEIVGSFTFSSEALESLSKLKPDVIFLDIDMPGQNGIQVAQRVTEIDDTIEIVFVTAYDNYALEAYNVQAVDYLLKPVQKERLARVLQRVMKRKQIKIPKETKEVTLTAQFIGNFLLYDVRGDIIKWRTKKAKELCAYLLYHKVPVHRTQILENLWGSFPLDKATTILHTTVYQLRKELKNSGFELPLTYEDEKYSLNINVHSDLEELLDKLNQNHYEDHTIISLLEVMEQGFLGLEDYVWAFNIKEKIDRQSKQYLEKYMNHFSTLLEKPDVWSSVLEKLIKIEPFTEKYYQELIKYMIETGQEKKAMEIYHQLKVLLWDELEVKPHKDTMILLQNKI